jgi:hypothetical protein
VLTSKTYTETDVMISVSHGETHTRHKITTMKCDADWWENVEDRAEFGIISREKDETWINLYTTDLLPLLEINFSILSCLDLLSFFIIMITGLRSSSNIIKTRESRKALSKPSVRNLLLNVRFDEFRLISFMYNENNKDLDELVVLVWLRAELEKEEGAAEENFEVFGWRVWENPKGLGTNCVDKIRLMLTSSIGNPFNNFQHFSIKSNKTIKLESRARKAEVIEVESWLISKFFSTFARRLQCHYRDH